MKALILVALGLSTALVSCAAVPAEQTNAFTMQHLLETCRNEGSPEYSMCLGYIHGVMDMTAFTNPNCPGNGVTVGAVVQAFRNYASQHPEYWNQPQVMGVLFAVTSTWRCNPLKPDPTPTAPQPPDRGSSPSSGLPSGTPGGSS